jgi:hypothetical protein
MICLQGACVCKYQITNGLRLNISKQAAYLNFVSDFGSGSKREKPGDIAGLLSLHLYCFNYTPWRETTMPTIFWREVIGAVWVRGFFECAGA